MTETPIIPGCNGLSLGIDVGSTTVKYALVRDGAVIGSCYERHRSQVRETLISVLSEASSLVGDEKVRVSFSGSAGMGIASDAGLPFIQEVFAETGLVRAVEDKISAVIELGGEDAKIIFLEGGIDERMNGTCAGGTGAFIDQMCSLLDITNSEMDEFSLVSTRLYPIASRCGVFAKTDIQTLLNQGACKEDICASVYQAIVDQTISGLAQGRKIKGRILYLGGPLSFCKGLRMRFTETLGLSEEYAILPSYSRISVALGAALGAHDNDDSYTISEIISKLRNSVPSGKGGNLPPLFASPEDYEAFKSKHRSEDVPRGILEDYKGRMFLGIDCGSTTTKLALVGEDGEILYSHYASNTGDPVSVVKNQLDAIYSKKSGDARICGSCVTGYGEDLVRAAFGVDYGLVETLAHFRAARSFDSDVDYILDIGGQDIKCFRIENGTIGSICLNEACSSGCGSFLQTFAHSLGYTSEEFALLGTRSLHPPDLGSRCTVFMNSSVKQAQKDGASPEDISAGLAISVVKNALYKVIRESGPNALGKHIVVQGGTFLNDSVLRALEMETGRDVIRPAIAGLMGAYGCALYARDVSSGESSLISADDLKTFSRESETVRCTGCGNACVMNVSTFPGGKRYVSGNACEKGLSMVGIDAVHKDIPNLYEFKRNLLRKIMKPTRKGNRPVVGIPMSLGIFETASFWKVFFENVGFDVVFSGFTDRTMVSKGRFTIPSDTVCYPAKVMHGHMLKLISTGVDAIFYPSLTYNINEDRGDNYYNCPVVAYYGELLNSNMDDLKDVRFLFPYLDINDDKRLARVLSKSLSEYNVSEKTALAAIKEGWKAYHEYKEAIFKEGDRALEWARKNDVTALILCGRPYHIDGEICHGMDKLANEIGFAVLSEDAIRPENHKGKMKVLDQWTYHSRMYNACFYAAHNEGVEMLQLVSFGCGMDAITSDEEKRILEEAGKMYTQIKIDEISNLGAARIRLRSMKGVLDERKVH